MSKELYPIKFIDGISGSESPEIQNECGLAAIFLTREGIRDGLNISAILYQMGTDLQHRAEGSAGMMISDGVNTAKVKELGLVSVAFNQGRSLPQLGDSKVGLLHMRYPTSGDSNHIGNIQPLERNGIWLGHHGNLTNAKQLEEQLVNVQKGGDLPDSDSWIALNAIARYGGESLGEKVSKAVRDFEGGWAIIVTDGKSVIATRDPNGVRPLFVGRLRSNGILQGYALSVETSVYKNISSKDFVEVLPGETIEINDLGINTISLNAEGQRSCIFEHVYMSHPDSVFLGELVHKTRRRAGENLWKESPVELEEGETLRVMPVPNSGRPSAAGFAAEARKSLGDKVDYEEGLLTNAYYGRNFIKPSSGREAKKKFYTVDYLIKGQTIALVDDSIVRGDTNKALVEMLREAGAKKVHVRVASPEVVLPCYWGVAFGTYEELIAHKVPDLKEREKYLSVDSLSYLSVNGLVEAVGVPKEQLCTHCFGGEGPKLPTGIVPLRET